MNDKYFDLFLQDTTNQGIYALHIGLDVIFQDMYPQTAYKSWSGMYLNRYKDDIPRGVYEPLNKMNNIKYIEQLQYMENDMTKMEAMKDNMESLIGDIYSMRSNCID